MGLQGVKYSALVFWVALSGCGRTTTITADVERVEIAAPDNTPVFPREQSQPDEDSGKDEIPSPQPSAVPSPRPSAEPNPSDGSPIDVPTVPVAPPAKVRVLVFPHFGRYATPQGRESSATQVRLISGGKCRSSKLADDSDAVIHPANTEFDFTVAEVRDPLRVTCDQALKILRDAPLKSLSYVGTFELHRSSNNNGNGEYIRVIDVLSLEEYLRGVVPSEMPGTWSHEALKVQAVAARTYATYQIGSPASNADPLYDLDDTVQFQAYQGVSAVTDNSDRAIRETAGQMIFFNGKTIVAFFSADSGGHTENAANVFGRAADAYCKGKEEVYDLDLGPKPWTVEVSLESLQNKLIAAEILKGADDLRAIEVDEHSRLDSGRATKIRLRLADGSVKTMTAGTLESKLGLRSRLFTITDNRITGRGFGHGVGMSQWGARILADHLQWDYVKVLQFYYTGVTVR